MARANPAANTAADVFSADANFNLPGFVQEVWSNRIISKLYDQTVFMSKVNRDYEGEIKGKGDSVRIFDVSPLTAKAYAIPGGRSGQGSPAGDGDISGRTGGVQYELMSGTSMPVQITEADYYGFEVEDIEEFFSNPKYMNKGAEEAARALNLATDRWIMGQMYAAAINATPDAFGRVGGTPTTPHPLVDSTDYTTNAVYEAFVDLGVLMDDNLVPEEGRWVVVPTFVEGLLLKDSRFVGAAAAGSGEARDKGKIGTISGFTVYKLARKTFQWYAGDATGPDGQAALTHQVTDALYTNDTGTDDYFSVAGVNSAFTFCDALVKNEKIRLQDAFADGIRGLHCYGGKAIRPNHLFGISCADSVNTASNE